MPLVACLATGLVGPDATTGERRVVTWKDPDEDDPEWQMSLDSTDDEVAAFAERLEEAYERRRGAALVLGRAPGVVVDAFRARRGTPTRAAVDYLRGPEEARPPRGTPPRDMAVILGSHALDVDALDRRLAESSRAPPTRRSRIAASSLSDDGGPSPVVASSEVASRPVVGTRADDRRSESAMEDRKKQGYF